MSCSNDALLLALMSMFGMVAANLVVSPNNLPKAKLVGALVVCTVMLPRIALALPFVEEPQIEFQFQRVLATVMIAFALFAWVSIVRRVEWSTKPSNNEELVTTGVYKFVRHPGYLGNILFSLGIAVFFGSLTGILLTPMWLAAFYIHAIIEENSLVHAHGLKYVEYQRRVRSRILPGLPL